MRDSRKQTYRIALLGLCTAVALILAYVESLIPPIYAAVPGIKLGLPNIAIVFVLYSFGWPAAALVSVVRVVAVALLFGNPMTLWYSLAGAVLSLVGMAILRHVKIFSVVGVSVAGAVLHNIGQILTAMILLGTAELGYYLIVLAITGTISGIFVGLCGGFAVKRIPVKNM